MAEIKISINNEELGVVITLDEPVPIFILKSEEKTLEFIIKALEYSRDQKEIKRMETH